MSDEIRTAVIAAMEDEQVRRAMADNVQKAVRETLQAADQKRNDPYRTTIYFLAGLIAFCLAVITGIFSAFPDPPIDTGDVVYRMLGGVLAWISITALVATVCMAFAQTLKFKHRKDAAPQDPDGTTLALLMGIPTFLGGIAVIYCIRGGMAVLHGNTELIGLLDALCKLVHF